MIKIILLVLACSILIAGCTTTANGDQIKEDIRIEPENLKMATFEGGCFWCMEHRCEKLEGVKEARTGYAGGHKEHPTYQEASSATTGHP